MLAHGEKFLKQRKDLQQIEEFLEATAKKHEVQITRMYMQNDQVFVHAYIDHESVAVRIVNNAINFTKGRERGKYVGELKL